MCIGCLKNIPCGFRPEEHKKKVNEQHQRAAVCLDLVKAEELRIVKSEGVRHDAISSFEHYCRKKSGISAESW